jgi:hypothetical protein
MPPPQPEPVEEKKQRDEQELKGYTHTQSKKTVQKPQPPESKTGKDIGRRGRDQDNASYRNGYNDKTIKEVKTQMIIPQYFCVIAPLKDLGKTPYV